MGELGDKKSQNRLTYTLIWCWELKYLVGNFCFKQCGGEILKMAVGFSIFGGARQ